MDSVNSVNTSVAPWGIDPQDDTIYRTQSGVVLKLKPVSSNLVLRRSSGVPVPEVPLRHWRVEGETEDRSEPNYSDPEYVKAVGEYNTRISYINMGSYMLLGTTVLELGSEIPPLESSVWSDMLSNKATWGDDAMDIPPYDEEHKDARYIFWMVNIVLRDIELAEISRQIRVLGGMVEEEAVREAMSSFRGLQEGTTDRGVEPNRQQRRDSNRGGKRVRSK